jgi:hypothetical protein
MSRAPNRKPNQSFDHYVSNRAPRGPKRRSSCGGQGHVAARVKPRNCTLGPRHDEAAVGLEGIEEGPVYFADDVDQDGLDLEGDAGGVAGAVACYVEGAAVGDAGVGVQPGCYGACGVVAGFEFEVEAEYGAVVFEAEVAGLA